MCVVLGVAIVVPLQADHGQGELLSLRLAVEHCQGETERVVQWLQVEMTQSKDWGLGKEGREEVSRGVDGVGGGAHHAHTIDRGASDVAEGGTVEGLAVEGRGERTEKG